MRRFLVGAIALMAALSTQTGVITAQPALDHDRFFCGFSWAPGGCLDTLNPAIAELRDTGVHRWAYIQEAGANLLPAVAQGLSEISAEMPNGPLMVYDPGGYRQIASGGMAFVYGSSLHGPGGTWAIGFVDGFPSRPVIVYDAATMGSWPRRSQVEVVLHESLHVQVNAGEGYRHGTSVPCGGVNDANRSVMGCGLTNAQEIGDYERQLWIDGHQPRPVDGAAVVGNVVWYAATDYKARLIAVIADGFGLVALGSPCVAPGIVCGAAALPPLPSGTGIWVKSQNALFSEATQMRFAGTVQ